MHLVRQSRGETFLRGKVHELEDGYHSAIISGTVSLGRRYRTWREMRKCYWLDICTINTVHREILVHERFVRRTLSTETTGNPPPGVKPKSMLYVKVKG